MPFEILEFGETYPDLNPDNLITLAGRKTLHWILVPQSRDFQLIELRYIKGKDCIIADVLVVDCLNDQVPSRNSVGIKNRERIALVFPVDESEPPSVRAPRKDFPITLHQNQVIGGVPASLCLYFEPWASVQRTWTPQKHLQRILWWLAETAKGTLHRPDQPVEQLYFESPIKLILPADFDELCKNDNLVLTMASYRSESNDHNRKVLIGEFLSKAEANNVKASCHFPVVVCLPPVVHSGIERFPSSIGQLDDQLSARGVSVFDAICKEAKRLTPQDGLQPDANCRSILILQIPVQRSPEGPIEKIETLAFLMLEDLSALGEAIGVLAKHEGKYYAVEIIGGSVGGNSGSWRDIQIMPVEIKRQVTPVLARQNSGVAEETSNFRGVLAGVGALGGALADLWSREGWGSWTLVDPDYVEPHNTIRHIAKNFQIGLDKAEAVKVLLEANYQNGASHLESINDSILNSSNPKLQEAISSANLIVDATTTLYVPRDLSQNPQNPRSASVFLTPSGFGSVLLIEDAERQVRLESLEAQYYRAILNNEWGSTHLVGHLANLWVGAGCRDVTAVISFEMVQLHAATLARRIRYARELLTPGIYVWEADSTTGSLAAFTPQVFPANSISSGSWRVLWDEDIRRKLVKYRAQCLPNETGGIILGYIDQKLRTIFVVDILPSPPDSDSSPSGFTRGVSGIKEILDEVAKRTANIVGYIGDWHSHPPQCSAQPSCLDTELIQALAETLVQDGQSALMMIVGDDGITITVKEIL